MFVQSPACQTTVIVIDHDHFLLKSYAAITWSMRFLRKVTDYLAPVLTTNPIDEFTKAFGKVLSCIPDSSRDATPSLVGALNTIQDYLAEEISEEKPDQPCVQSLIGNSLLARIVGAIDESLPAAHVEPILNFFLAFVNTCLNRLFPQISVHRSFTKFLGRLPLLALRDRSATLAFANDLWASVKNSPVALELISSEHEQPLIDFFCMTALAPGEDGELSREALMSIASDRGPTSGKYFQAHFFPQLADFILNTSLCGSTIQFNGSLSSLIEWIDFLLLPVDQFPCELILNGLAEAPISQKILAIAFLLSFFSAQVITKPIGGFALSQKFLGTVIDALQSSDDRQAQKSAIAFLRALFETELDLSPLFPAPTGPPCDLLSLLPSEWLGDIVGSTRMDAYEVDALVRLQFFDGRRSSRGNCPIFTAVLVLLPQFDTLPLPLCLSITKVVTAFVSLAPDLISEELAAAFSAAVATLSGVSELGIPDDGLTDSPSLRAVMLTEFAKEVHATYVASERLNSLLSLEGDCQ
jgi:hypothetical protein